jgi:hypothetical protein
MPMALGVEMVVGVFLLFGGGAWLVSELETLGRGRSLDAVVFDFLLLGAPMGLAALAVAGAGGYIVWNGLMGGPLLLDPDKVRPWLPH